MVQAYGRLDFRQDLKNILIKIESILRFLLQIVLRSAKTNLQGGISLLKKKYSHVSHQKECRMRRLQDLKLKYRDTQF